MNHFRGDFRRAIRWELVKNHPVGLSLGKNGILQRLPNEQETDLVRRIFNRFIRLGSTTLLCKELNDQGFRTKPRRNRDGKMNNGFPFNKTTLYKILNNRLYLGEIRHGDKWYPGEHQAIVELDMWEKAHSIMAKNRVERAADVRRQTPAPLKGLLFGPDGKAMTPTHTKRGDKRYRYYITHTANKRGHEECPVRMVRAGDLEGIVFDQIKTIFKNPALIVSTWSVANSMDDGITEDDVRDGLQNIEAVWPDNLRNTNKERQARPTSNRMLHTIKAERGSKYACPVCGEACAAHDFQEKTWRHLNSSSITMYMPRCRG